MGTLTSISIEIPGELYLWTAQIPSLILFDEFYQGCYGSLSILSFLLYCNATAD